MRDAVIKQLLYKSFNHEPALTPDWDTATRVAGAVHSPLHSFGAHPPDKEICDQVKQINISDLHESEGISL